MNVAPCPVHGGPPVSFCHDCGAYTVEPEASTTDVPPERREVPDTRTEKQIEAQTIKDLTALGYRANKMSEPRATMKTEGPADLYVQGHGVRAWCEMKKPGEKQRPTQIEFEAAEVANGGNYRVCYSEAEAVAWVESLRGTR